MGIGELSGATGVSVRALRYYGQHGLLAETRDGGGHRRYRPDAPETVRRIRLFLEAGMPLAVVAQIMPCFVGDGARLHACVAEYLRAHLDVLLDRVEELDRQRGVTERLRQLVAL